jgi:WD40 repeat protein
VTTVWRTRDGASVAVIPTGQVRAVDLSSNGRFVMTEGIDHPGRTVWRVSSRKKVPALRGTIAFDADARRAVVTGARAGVRVVAVADGRSVSTLRGVRSLDGAAFSPDGARLVGVAHGRLGLWDAVSGRLVSRLDRRGGWSAPRFSPDGKLVFASASRRVSVWRASDGKLVETLPTPGLASFSSDGAFAAIPEDGGRVAIVDLAAGVTTELQTGTVAPLKTATFGPGSRLLVAWDANGNVQVVACEICAGQGLLTTLARARLAHVSRFRPRSPVVGYHAVG